MNEHASVTDQTPDPKTALFERVLESWQTAFPDLDVTSISVSVSISRLASLFTRGAEELVRPYGFGYGEMEVLFYLLSGGKPYEMRPSDLVKGCFVTSGAITGRVDRLSRLGLVSRVPSLIDRREMLVKLTRNGEKLGRRLQQVVAYESALRIALDELPAERRAALDADLRSVLIRVENLTSQVPSGSNRVVG
ncbi:MarR family transcriptional regulator [Novosphingobium sp.]|uniref:MarR family winged helix-turn-helix transcriptional regulator n=1 Tax=Novosphingobium sp. TaxID=1874826 RepID=UPI00262715E3|nr:MarR family transcriptional regulator [Novosphingobium sp.]